MLYKINLSCVLLFLSSLASTNMPTAPSENDEKEFVLIVIILLFLLLDFTLLDVYTCFVVVAVVICLRLIHFRFQLHSETTTKQRQKKKV